MVDLLKRLRSGPPVHRQVRGRTRFEVGAPATAEVEDVAVLAHWSDRPRVTRSVATLVRELQACGYCVVVSSSAPVEGPLEWGDDVDRDRLVVLRKPNVGYDFGSWSVALELVPGARRARRTLVLNDSMAGPFVGLGPLLAGWEASAFDVWSLTANDQFAHHLQSYFLGFRGGLLDDRPLRTFWRDVRHHDDKQQVIFDYELGLTQLLRERGYVHGAAFDQHRVAAPGDNPVIRGWRGLLDLGFPFVKRELLRDTSVADDAAEVPAQLRQRFGVDVRTWVDDEVPAA